MITATLKRTWELVDGEQPIRANRVFVQPGTYRLDRVPNPYGFNAPWLVIVDTSIGMAEGAWRQWENGVLSTNPTHPNFGLPIDWGEFEIVISEVPDLEPQAVAVAI